MKLGNGLGASGAYFLKVFFLGGHVERSVCSEEWASCSVLVWQGWLTIVNNALGWVSVSPSSECAQVAIFSVCYEWRICSVWQVAWERMNGCSYVVERTMQFSPLLREGGLRNDAAGAALWRTRPYECAIDVCQLLTTVIASVHRVEFSSLMFATNGGFVRFDNVVNTMETFERDKLQR